MSKNEEWNAFLGNLLSCSLNNLQTTKEYEYRQPKNMSTAKSGRST